MCFAYISLIFIYLYNITSLYICTEILEALSSSSPSPNMTVCTTTQTNVGVHDGVTGSHDITIVHHSPSVSSVTSTTTNVNSTICLPQGKFDKLCMYSIIIAKCFS